MKNVIPFFSPTSTLISFFFNFFWSDASTHWLDFSLFLDCSSPFGGMIKCNLGMGGGSKCKVNKSLPRFWFLFRWFLASMYATYQRMHLIYVMVLFQLKMTSNFPWLVQLFAYLRGRILSWCHTLAKHCRDKCTRKEIFIYKNIKILLMNYQRKILACEVGEIFGVFMWNFSQ